MKRISIITIALVLTLSLTPFAASARNGEHDTMTSEDHTTTLKTTDDTKKTVSKETETGTEVKRERLAVERALGEVALLVAGRTVRLHREPEGRGVERSVQTDRVENGSVEAERFVEIVREVLARAGKREVRVVGAGARAVVRVDHGEIEIARAPSLHEIRRRAGELAARPHRAGDQRERPVVGADALS